MNLLVSVAFLKKYTRIYLRRLFFPQYLVFPQKKSNIIWVEATWRLPWDIKCCAYQVSYVASFLKDLMVLPPGAMWLVASWQAKDESLCSWSVAGLVQWWSRCAQDLGKLQQWKSRLISRGHASGFKSACGCYDDSSGCALLCILPNLSYSSVRVLLSYTLGVGQGNTVLLKWGWQTWWRLGLTQDRPPWWLCVAPDALLLSGWGSCPCVVPCWDGRHTASERVQSSWSHNWSCLKGFYRGTWIYVSTQLPPRVVSAGQCLAWIPQWWVWQMQEETGTWASAIGLAWVALSERFGGRAGFVCRFLCLFLWCCLFCCFVLFFLSFTLNYTFENACN